MSMKLMATTVGVGLLLLVLSASGVSVGEAAAREPGEGELTRLDRDLQRYWGSERRMPAVKNRLYTKQGRGEVGLFGAMITNDPFRNYWLPGVKAGYFPWEHLGFSLTYAMPFNTESSLEDWLNSRLPDSEAEMGDVINGMVHLDAVFAPLYGKFNLFGMGSLNFDLYFSSGLGMAMTEYVGYDADGNKDASATSRNPFLFNAGFGFRFYATDMVSVKLEATQYLFGRNPNFESRDSLWQKLEKPTMFSLGVSGMLPAFGR